ncbi:hypothetical protein EVA_19477 [gut metagenome]|uniref:Uncharacterized protein n=1 Tax=gut metagenome TaxID=749906 RepID=J9FBZ4_9ZZZZ
MPGQYFFLHRHIGSAHSVKPTFAHGNYLGMNQELLQMGQPA